MRRSCHGVSQKEYQVLVSVLLCESVAGSSVTECHR